MFMKYITVDILPHHTCPWQSWPASPEDWHCLMSPVGGQWELSALGLNLTVHVPVPGMAPWRAAVGGR